MNKNKKYTESIYLILNVFQFEAQHIELNSSIKLTYKKINIEIDSKCRNEGTENKMEIERLI